MAALAADLGVGQTSENAVSHPSGEDEHEDQDGVLRCSFCGKDQDQLRRLIAGPDVHICADCVEVCVDLLADDKGLPTGATDSEGRVVGSITVARCSLCREPTLLAELTTVETRGALCGSCSAIVDSWSAREFRSKALSRDGCPTTNANEARDR